MALIPPQEAAGGAILATVADNVIEMRRHELRVDGSSEHVCHLCR